MTNWNETILQIKEAISTLEIASFICKQLRLYKVTLLIPSLKNNLVSKSILLLGSFL